MKAKKKRLRESAAWDVPEKWPGQTSAAGRLLRTYKPYAVYGFIAYMIITALTDYVGLTALDLFSIGLQLAMQVVHILIYFGFFFWYLAGRISVKVYYPGDIKLTWDDFRGLDSIKERAMMLVSDLANPGLAKELGGIRTAHALFSGLPGTGKTLLAKIVAAQAGVPVMVVSAGSLLGCVKEDTILFTNRGLIPIGSLDPGLEPDSTVLLSGLQATGLRNPATPATELYKSPPQATIRICTRRGYILEGTVEHPVVAMRKESGRWGWYGLQRLHRGDFVAIRGADLWGQERLNSDVAYLMGALVSDGCFTETTQKVQLITTDPNIAERCRHGAKQLGLEFVGPLKHGGSSSTYRIGKTGKGFSKTIERLGLIPAKGPQKEVPPIIMRADRETVIAFLQGLFDGDGSLHKNRNVVTYVTSSATLAKQVHLLLTNLGVYGYLKGREETYNSVTRMWYRIQITSLFARHFMEEIGFHTPRKRWPLVQPVADGKAGIPAQGRFLHAMISRLARKNRRENWGQGNNIYKQFSCLEKAWRSGGKVPKESLEHFLDASRATLSRGRAWKHLRGLADLDVLWDEIICIETGWGQNYDMVTPGEHNFVANGIVSGPTFVGMGRLKVVQLFAKCFRLENIWKGVIMVWDEIDSIGGARGGQGQTYSMFGGSPGMQVLNEVLTQLSGISDPSGWKHRFRQFLKKGLGIPYQWKHPNFLVIAATNRPDVLDPALIRSGRLEQRIDFPVPTRHGLADGIGYYLADWRYEGGGVGVPHDETCDPKAMAWLATGSTLADVERYVNDCKRLAKKAGRPYIIFEDWSTSVTEGRMGLRQPMPLTDRDKVGLATHEAGHAIMVKALEWMTGQPWPLPIATIERYGSALGHIQFVPEQEHIREEQSDLEFRLMISLGSLAAEQLAGSRTPGTSADLNSVQWIIRLMISQGMIGDPFMIKRLKEAPLGGTEIALGELTKRGEETAVTYYKQRVEDAIRIIAANSAAMDALVTRLLAEGTLFSEAINETVGDLVIPGKLTSFKEETENE